MNHSLYMAMALEEGRKGLGEVHPNPPVGCVIVSEKNIVIGRGAHLVYGEAHAEINALSSVKNRETLRGSTVYVTLEPCAHEAKTPSCAKALAELPIAKVVYALRDPNPKVSGQGAQILRDAGIETEMLEDEILVAQCRVLAEIFHWNMKKNSPFVAIKAATSLNGSIRPDADSKWITGQESREYVHYLRSQYDAVLIGVSTFLEDNPKLNIRKRGHQKENYSIVLDPAGRGLSQLKDSELYKSRRPEKIIWVVTEDVVAPSGIHVMRINRKDESMDLEQLLQKLWDFKIYSIFVEGGAHTYGGFLNKKLVNRIFHFTGKVEVSETNMLNWLSYAKNELLSVGPIERKHFGADEFQSFLLGRT